MNLNIPIVFLDDIDDNKIYIKRDDLIPFSFGGNKARKAQYFFEEIDSGGYDCVVTYGTSSSNHCRVIANMAAKRKLPCILIGPSEVSKETFNSKLMKALGAKIITVPVDEVHDTIETKLDELRQLGKKPYFIEGGGHGNLGTQAYVDCYREITSYEKETGTVFDYIFFASGTGTTQAGLVCGKLIEQDDKKIIGISIARKKPHGRDVVVDSIKKYFNENNFDIDDEMIEEATIFDDSYTASGYGKDSETISGTIKEAFIKYGLPLDSTYTGKAFTGMKDYIRSDHISGKNILFIHTGGTPLFFDNLKDWIEK